MATFYKQLSDEDIELMAEETEKEQQNAVHNLQVKRKKLLETGNPEDDENINITSSYYGCNKRSRWIDGQHMKDNKNIDLFSSVSVLITNHDSGFSLGIIDPKPSDERDIASYIAKGMVQMAMDRPEELYEAGVKAFENSLLSIEDNTEEYNDNVLDLIEFKNKKDLH